MRRPSFLSMKHVYCQEKAWIIFITSKLLITGRNHQILLFFFTGFIVQNHCHIFHPYRCALQAIDESVKNHDMRCITTMKKRYTVITGFPIGSEMKMIGFGNSHPFLWHCR